MNPIVSPKLTWFQRFGNLGEKADFFFFHLNILGLCGAALELGGSQGGS